MYLKVSAQGGITIPEELRRGLTPNTLLEAVRRDDGVIELRPHEIDPDQAWFWTETWQRMEREADDDIAAGRHKTFDSVEEFLADLDSDLANE